MISRGFNPLITPDIHREIYLSDHDHPQINKTDKSSQSPHVTPIATTREQELHQIHVNHQLDQYYGKKRARGVSFVILDWKVLVNIRLRTRSY